MDFFTRRMSVTNSKSGETREVTHFQYVSWPDYGVPVMADTMLNFRHKVLNLPYSDISWPPQRFGFAGFTQYVRKGMGAVVAQSLFC